MAERSAGTSAKWRVTPSQKERLLAAFSEEPYPSPKEKAALALQLGVTGTQISKWFQHRRESLTRLGQFKAQYNRSRRTEHEVKVLQKAFDENSYPTAERLAQLESELKNVTSKQIKLWFKHRRKQSRLRSATAFHNTVNSPHKRASVTTGSIGNSSNTPIAEPNCLSANGRVDTSQLSNELRTLSSHEIPFHDRTPPSSTATVLNAMPTSSMAVYPPFSALELMALRGALCMSKSLPSPSGLQTLSTFLGRPIEHLRLFFDSELRGGYFWNYLTTIESQPIITTAPLPSSALFPAMAATSPPTAPTTPSLHGTMSSKTLSLASPALSALSPYGKPWSTGFKSGESSSNPYSIGVASPLLKLPDVSTPLPTGPAVHQVWYVPPVLGTARAPLPSTTPTEK